MFDDQIARIRSKLDQARDSDAQFEVFGSETHRYQLGDCLSAGSIEALEKRISVALPEDYRAFIEHIGNGGRPPRQTGAGPYYGLDPVEAALQMSASLTEPARIRPEMTDQEWEALIDPPGADEMGDEEFEDRVFGGLLRIGDQGCTYSYAIALNGDHRGRVVNLDDDLGKPFFAFEHNFLDWYERWLDEVIGGGLRQPGSWFGFTMGGDDRHLLQVYQDAEHDTLKLEALEGFYKLKSIEPESCQYLSELCRSETGDLRRAAICVLTKFDVSVATPHLRQLIDLDDDSCRQACQSIHWYARDRATIWQDQLMARLPQTSNLETFRFIVYVVQDANGSLDKTAEFGDSLAASAMNSNEKIRETAIWALGSLGQKSKFIDALMLGLNDQSPKVVRAALQALAGVEDERLLEAYVQLCKRFESDVEYVLTNLDHRLRENGFRDRGHFLSEFSPSN
jgi:SMI1 / KNR4 family (SUKH-1)/HEAT repeats